MRNHPIDPQGDPSHPGILVPLFTRYGPVRVFATILILYIFFVITYHAGILIPILKWAGIIILCLASFFGICAIGIVGIVVLFFKYLDYLRESEQQEEPKEGEIPE